MYTKHCTPTSCAGIWILEQLHQFNIYRPAQTNFPVACFLLYRFLLWQSLALLLHRYEPSILLQWPHLSHFQGRRRVWGCHGLWPQNWPRCLHACRNQWAGFRCVHFLSAQPASSDQVLCTWYVRISLVVMELRFLVSVLFSICISFGKYVWKYVSKQPPTYVLSLAWKVHAYQVRLSDFHTNKNAIQP